MIVITLFFFCIEVGFAQLRLKKIPYDLSQINKRDANGKQGVWFFYEKLDSTVYAMQNFTDDTLNGYFERYWHNGKISEKGFYKNGNLDSIFIAYWENGQKRGEANYINGQLNGVVTSFNQKGELTSRLKYLNGEVDSDYEASFIDSSMVWDNQASNKMDTVTTTYKSDWNKKYAIYTNDTLSKEISFYKDVATIENFYERAGLIKRIIYSKSSPYNIEKVFYYQNGKLIKTELYDKQGKRVENK